MTRQKGRSFRVSEEPATSDAATARGDIEISREGAILRIEFNRPKARNSLNHDMVSAVVEALTAAASDDGLRAVHITGAGGHFCAGADLVSGNAASGERPRTGKQIRRVPHAQHRIIELVTTIQLPVVATVRGWAAGLGCNLALAADFTVAADDAMFWEPFMSRGFTPDTGSTWLLPRLVGLTRAKQMLLLGDKVSGTQAADWGLIHAAATESELDAVSDRLLERVAAGPTVAFGLAKYSLHENLHQNLPTAMNNELYALELSTRTTDFKEGLAAFRERRDPDFTGR
ncbi:enoyl-CoA hydratase/isomerase family protein [Gordonia pseudamarae]|uniref:Enoyl-CoA hydratase/isomerase family protein n=1 Tax=Gordonia pseudamarae TaxID=2831662 RepID=A0ABX6IDY6_9ACTN|nr:enoyl-CoA hydratase/isomerase family protein [Gordonia pseudamarae]QHN34009.1 enoyl-CoA hydratase/isomerase family protein [Gordonia pseudamarae]